VARSRDGLNPPGAEEAPLPLAIKPGQGGTPEVVSARDPGSMLVNYRNEPIPLRIAQRQGNGSHDRADRSCGRLGHARVGLARRHALSCD
jgi:hypothetical protein